MSRSNNNLFTLPLWARALNAAGSGLQKVGLAPVNLTPESICAAAQKKTGLSDFGGDDFCRRVARGLEAARTEAKESLSVLGRLSVRLDFVRHAEIQLRSIHYRRQFPEINQLRWERPIFIVGLPRTGTTFLHKLLCQDPAARVPFFWELHMPAPPAPATPPENDPRIQAAHTFYGRTRPLTWRYDNVHPLDPDGPEECVFLMMGVHLITRARVPQYVDYLFNGGVEAEYQTYFAHMQLMQWHNNRGRYVSKTPFHLLGVDQLLSHFPDAAVIHTHRRLDETIPSWLSLASLNQLLHEKRLDRPALVKYWLEIWRRGLEKTEAARQTAGPGRFYDLYYDDLTADPLAAVQAIYQHFGYNLTSEAAEKMRRWLAEDRQKRPSTPHRYSLEQFGLTRRQLGDYFSAYAQQFNVME